MHAVRGTGLERWEGEILFVVRRQALLRSRPDSVPMFPASMVDVNQRGTEDFFFFFAIWSSAVGAPLTHPKQGEVGSSRYLKKGTRKVKVSFMRFVGHFSSWNIFRLSATATNTLSRLRNEMRERVSFQRSVVSELLFPGSARVVGE